MSAPADPGNGNRSLLTDFPLPNDGDWRSAAEQLLKGAPFDNVLITRTVEGFDLRPIYRRTDIAALPELDSLPGQPPYLRGARSDGYRGRPWDIVQGIPAGDPATFNAELRTALAAGQNAVFLDVPLSAAGSPLPDSPRYPEVSGPESLGTALADVPLGETALYLDPGEAALPLGTMVYALAREREVDDAHLRGSLGADPLGVLAERGRLTVPLATLYDELASLVKFVERRSPGMAVVTVRGEAYHNAGAGAAQELAAVIAGAIAYLREMDRRGIAPATFAPHLALSFGIGPNLFMEMAKLRAARLLWHRVMTVLLGSDAAVPPSLHAVTGRWNKSTLDPYVNLLRTTTEGFAAVTAMVDSLRIDAFDAVARTPSPLGQRLARNLHIILREEAHLNKVIDPAGGSWYVETLTRQLAEAAWEQVQIIEKAGGLAAALREGIPQKAVDAVARGRLQNLQTRKDRMVGVNVYPNAGETPLEGNGPPPDPAAADGHGRAATPGELSKAQPNTHKQARLAVEAFERGTPLTAVATALRRKNSPGETIRALEARRAADAFERLRAAMRRHAKSAGEPLTVFLARLGRPPEFRARADFAREFFAAGGFAVAVSTPADDAAEAAREAAAAVAPIVVICSADAAYPDRVPAFMTALREAGSEAIVVLAGHPADQVEAHRASGVAEFIHLRANLYEVLVHLMSKLGVLS